MRTIRQAFLLAGKDLALELRTKESLNASAAFSVVILLLFSFVFDPGAEETKEFGSGMLWLVFAFAGALVFNRGFARELPNECLDTLLASPLSAASLVLGKALANLAMLVVVEVISLFVFGLFFDIRWWLRPAELAGVSLLATWGIFHHRIGVRRADCQSAPASVDAAGPNLPTAAAAPDGRH